MKINKKEQVLSLLKQTHNLFTRLERNDLAENVYELQNKLISSEKTIVICGEFKRGKSSLINGLIQRKGLCPVDIDIATSVVSMISYGERPLAMRWYGNVGGESKEKIAFEDISKYATGKDTNKDPTWMLKINVPNNYLKRGITVIDTPGVGGLDPRHGFLTSYFIPRADVVIFTIDASEPLSQSELTFLKEKFDYNIQQLVIVLNKIDLCEDPDTLVSDIKDKLIDVLGDKALEIPIIPVSSQLMNDYLQDGDDEDFEESNFRALLLKIDEAVVKHDDSLVNAIAIRAIHLLQDVYEPLIIQSQKINLSDDESKQKMELQIRKQKQRINEFVGPAASWRVTLSSEMNKLKMDAVFELKDRLIDLTNKKVKQILESEGIDVDLDRIINKLENEISCIANEVDEMITKQMIIIYTKIADNLFLERDTIRLSKEKFTYSFEPTENIQKTSKVKAMLSTTNVRNTIFAAGVFQIPVIGWAAAIYLVFDGVKTSLERAKKENIQKISSAISADIQKSTLALQKHTDIRIKESEAIMKKMVQNEIERMSKNYDEIQDALKSINKRTEKENAQYEKLVNVQIRPIEQLIKYFERI